MQPNAKTTQYFMQFFAKEFGEDIWSRISAEENARGLSAPALIIHDRDDRDVPWQSSERLAQAWPGAELLYTQGLGHRRILRDPALLQRVVDFISN